VATTIVAPGVGPSQRQPKTPKPLRRDPTGEITRSLERLIEQGSAITRRLLVLGGDHELQQWGGAIERWRVACLEIVSVGFEREAALEFLGASAVRCDERRTGPSVRSELCRVEDAIGMLNALQGTLRRRG
jgi:hypothetical protein